MHKNQNDGEVERLKRLAAQMFAQLPENREEALKVVLILRELVDWEPTAIEPLLKIVS